MSATYVSSAGQGVPTATPDVTLNEPAGATGDLLVAFCWANNTVAAWTPPAGWTADDADAGAGAAIFHKTAADTGGNPQTFTRSNNTGAAGVVIVRIADASAVAAADIVNGGASTNLVLPSIAAAVADTLLLQIACKATTTAGTWTPPGTATERADTTTAGNALPYAVGDEVVAAGAAGTRTWVSTNSQQSRGAILALSPDAAPVLAPSDTVNTHTSDSPTLAQVHHLTPADTVNTHTTESPTLAQVHELFPVDTVNTHTSESPALTENLPGVLSPDNTVNTHTSESPTLAQVHVLNPNDTTNSHTSSSPTLTQHGDTPTPPQPAWAARCCIPRFAAS